MPRKSFNHGEGNIFTALGLVEATSSQNITTVINSLDALEDKSFSKMAEHVEKGLSKRELALVAVQALNNSHKVSQELEYIRQAFAFLTKSNESKK